MLTGLQVQKAQRGLSLDPDADWVREANSLVQSWQAAQQKEAGGGGPADKQSGSGKPHAQAKKGKQQKQSKKQAKKQKRQAQQQQQQQAKQQEEDQLRQQQQQQQQQEQSSSSKQHDRPKAADNKKPFGGGASGSAAHGHHSYTYGPQGQQTESAEPQMNSPSVATFEWLSAGMLLGRAIPQSVNKTLIRRCIGLTGIMQQLRRFLKLNISKLCAKQMYQLYIC